jgi:hypothetical protein
MLPYTDELHCGQSYSGQVEGELVVMQMPAMTWSGLHNAVNEHYRLIGLTYLAAVSDLSKNSRVARSPDFDTTIIVNQVWSLQTQSGG